MKKLILLIFITFFSVNLFSQSAKVVFEVLPISLNSQTYSIKYNTNFRGFKSRKVEGTVMFTIEIVDRKDLNNFSAVGKIIDTFIESFSSSKIFIKDYTLPNSIFFENIPENKAYRIIADSGTIFTKRDNETLGTIRVSSKKGPELTIKGRLTKVNIQTKSNKNLNKKTTLTLKNKTIVIFPNPAHNKISIDKNLNTKSYKVYDLSGKFIKEARANGVLLISELNPGIYYLVTDVGVAKFTKQ